MLTEKGTMPQFISYDINTGLNSSILVEKSLFPPQVQHLHSLKTVLCVESDILTTAQQLILKTCCLRDFMLCIRSLRVNLSMKWHNTAYNLVVLNRY